MPDDAAIKDFLNPKSMLTPGVAGGITMLIGNTLWVQFGLQPRWTGLCLSFIIGLLVFTAIEMVLWQRIAYWILNSLIIFSMGVGAHTLGATSVGVGKLGNIFGPVPNAYAADSQGKIDKADIEDGIEFDRILGIRDAQKRKEALDQLTTRRRLRGQTDLPPFRIERIEPMSNEIDDRKFFNGPWTFEIR